MQVVCFRHNVPDPVYYDSLISEQKKKLREQPNRADEWLELGRLFEARIDMINSYAKRHFLFRYFYFVNLIGISILIYTLLKIEWNILSVSSQYRFLIPLIIIFAVICLILNVWIWYTRYPPSGIKYFKKAIAVNPNCADAYMYLGLIALRRRRKRKAYDYLEKAISLKSNNSNKIEQKLTALYEKEFLSFFNKIEEKNVHLIDKIENQRSQIKKLNEQNAYLESNNIKLSEKLEQLKWELAYERKKAGREIEAHVSEINQINEVQMEAFKKEAEIEAKEMANQKFVNLTMEIMEEKAKLEVRSLEKAAESVKDIVGDKVWTAFSEQTRNFLATSEQVYTMLSDQEENADFSLVGMELCKALETEINRKLIKPFKKSIDGNLQEFLRINKTGEIKGKPTYFNYLAKLVDTKHYPDVNYLTLGQYHYVLNLALSDDYALQYYQEFLRSLNGKVSKLFGKRFLKDIEIVTFKYRNAIAHQKPIGKDEFEKLRFMVLSSESSLIKIISKI